MHRASEGGIVDVGAIPTVRSARRIRTVGHLWWAYEEVREVALIPVGSRPETATLMGVEWGLCELIRTPYLRKSENPPSRQLGECTFVGCVGPAQLTSFLGCKG